VDAAELTAQVVADFRKEVEPRGVTVQLDADSAPLPMRADAPSLTNALWNLLDNAVKYSPERDMVHVSVHRHPSGVAIAVQDHGLGIPRREQGEIFRRFVRGEQASRLGIKGTGLGLAMVSHIVEAHGGAIELESEEGAGSTFRLVFPERG
jgi:signal transduction histidine kinase